MLLWFVLMLNRLLQYMQYVLCCCPLAAWLFFQAHTIEILAQYITLHYLKKSCEWKSASLALLSKNFIHERMPVCKLVVEKDVHVSELYWSESFSPLHCYTGFYTDLRGRKRCLLGYLKWRWMKKSLHLAWIVDGFKAKCLFGVFCYTCRAILIIFPNYP